MDHPETPVEQQDCLESVLRDTASPFAASVTVRTPEGLGEGHCRLMEKAPG